MVHTPAGGVCFLEKSSPDLSAQKAHKHSPSAMNGTVNKDYVL